MELNTVEKFLLLALHPEKGRFRISDVHLKFGTIGAILLDLSIQKFISLQNGYFHINKNAKLMDKNYCAFGKISNLVLGFGNEKKPKYWMRRLARYSKTFRWIFLYHLEKQKLVRIEQRSFLCISYKKCFLIHKQMRNKLVHDLRENILYKKKKPDDVTAILGIIEACKMYKTLSRDRSEQKTMKKELKSVLKDSPISQTVESTIKQVQIAITAAIAASVVASSGGR